MGRTSREGKEGKRGVGVKEGGGEMGGREADKERGERERGILTFSPLFSLSLGWVREGKHVSVLPTPPRPPLPSPPSPQAVYWFGRFLSPSLSLSAFLFLFLFVSALSLFVRSSVCLSACLSICLYLSCLSSACLFVYLPSCQSVYLFVYMSVYLLHLEFLCLWKNLINTPKDK